MTELLDAVDTFGGPGGWDVAAQALGLHVLGIEWDKHACGTRRAAGLPTVEGDVRRFGPFSFPSRGHISSPPCPTFSMAGKGSGRADMATVISLARWVADTGLAARPRHQTISDERTTLVLEPLRWAVRAARAGRPFEWIALEQVPPVLPIWEAVAEHLGGYGYSVATGVVSAEQYGVPQTRKRAVLLARLGKPVTLPTPTHSRYYPRDPERLDGVLPWVSMAEVLGLDTEDHIRSNYGTGGNSTCRGERFGFEPAATVTSKAGRNLVYVNGNQANAARRPATRPAPTVHFGAACNDVRWYFDRRTVSTKGGGVRYPTPTVPVDRPAPTITGSGSPAWVGQRPSTTVAGDPRIAAPGHRAREAGARQFDERTVFRVTVEQAAALQTFPDDHPWQGSKSAQYQQVGNAIPPLLAYALLKEVTQ